jgi:hypothetical protein
MHNFIKIETTEGICRIAIDRILRYYSPDYCDERGYIVFIVLDDVTSVLSYTILFPTRDAADAYLRRLDNVLNAVTINTTEPGPRKGPYTAI